MRSHYAITTTIRYYKSGVAFDVSRWKDAPHVALANLRDEPEAVLRFTRIYGALARDKTVDIPEVLDYRDFLRRAWEGDAYNFFALPSVKDIWLIAQPTGMEITVSALWPLIQFLFSRDWAEKRIKKCANPDCPAPYFRAVRRGQRFCSQKCAVLINVRHFREREAARKAKGERYAKAKKA